MAVYFVTDFHLGIPSLEDSHERELKLLRFLDGITPKRVREAADEFRTRGVEVTSLGLFTDLRNPEEEKRKAGRD